MADSNTTTYSFTLPEVGASADSWGTKLNANWDKVDDLLDGSIAVNGITVTGGSIDGTAIGATTPSTGAFTSVTADGLTISGSSTGTLNVANFLNTDSSANATANRLGLGISNSSGANYTYIEAKEVGADNFAEMNFYTGISPAKRMTVGTYGDVSFYEDTGTTAKFVWDSSAESLGIGGTPSTILDVIGEAPTLTLRDSRVGGTWSAGTALGKLDFYTSDGTGIGAHSIASIGAVAGGANTASPDGELVFSTGPYNVASVERMRIDSSGNVGIGTASPSAKLDVIGSVEFGTNEGSETNAINWVKGTDNRIAFKSTANPDYTSGSWGGLQFHSANGYGGSLAGIAVNHRYGDGTEKQFADAMSFMLKGSGSADNWSEVMSLRSSGNVGIGTVSPSAKLQSVTTNNSDVAISAYETTIGGEAKIDLSVRNNGSSATPVSRVSSIMSSGTVGAEAGHLKFSTMSSGTLAERARIDSSGNLLVGTTVGSLYNTSSNTGVQIDGTNANISIARSGGRPIDLNRLGTDGEIARFSKNGATVGSIGTIGGFMTTGTKDTGLVFNDYTNQIYPWNMTTNSSTNGAVDLGSTGARFKDLYLSGAAYLQNSTGGSGGLRLKNPSNNTNAKIATFTGWNNTETGNISTYVNVTSYNTSSDYRLKEDIVELPTATDDVMSLKPCNFAWKGTESRMNGFIAHELAEIVPEAVTGEKDAMRTEEYEVTPAVLDDNGNVVTEAVIGTREVPEYQSIDQSKLVPLLTKALQEAITKIEQLETRIETLENN